jgi:hypothetical protein
MNFLLAFPSIAALAIIVPALAFCWFSSPSTGRRRTEWLLCAVLLVVPAGMAAQLIANAMSPLRPFKYDLYIYRFDSFFGEPSFRLGQVVFAHSWVKDTLSVAYGLMPIAMFLAFAICLIRQGEREALAVARTFVLLYSAGVVFYLILPVCGPVYAFPTFPILPHILPPITAAHAAHPIILHAPPNGVPSEHMSSALVCLWFLRRWTPGAIAGVAFAILTVLATLGSGQHYLFDLILAVPFTAAVLWLSRSCSQLKEESR